jgi:hypothetical protein
LPDFQADSKIKPRGAEGYLAQVSGELNRCSSKPLLDIVFSAWVVARAGANSVAVAL